VNWPLEVDTGKMGAKCGRVLHTLDALNENDDGTAPSLFSSKRPICLWDPRHTVEESDRIDDWGRSKEYTRISTKTEYIASSERYYNYGNDDDSSAVSLWEDFCRVHWPKAMAGTEKDKEETRTTTTTTRSNTKHLFVDRQLRQVVAA
jgi:hypothetical protein